MKNKVKFLLLSFFILILFITSGCEIPAFLSELPSEQTDGLTVSFIDVGQGDAALIECDGEAMLIDSGLYSEKNKVINYISKQKIQTLKYSVATHPHSDHIGAMSSVIYSFDVDFLVYPLCENDSAIMNDVLDACDEKGVSYITPEPGDTFSLGSATFTVLSPAAYSDYNNLNNNSIVLKLEYGNASFLFMGDAETEVEKELLNSGFSLNADVIKCGHHGSSTSSDAQFISTVNPSAAIISCGKNNDYGHPHRETLSTLNNRGIEVLRTDKLSTIVAATDGETITFTAENEVLTTISANKNHTSEYSYTGNVNSKIFHYNHCDSVAEMSDKNKIFFNNRSEALTKGYTPCKACNP